jgi:hypothetical protein
MQHIKDQNWFAVGLDVLVVIVGIILGTQVNNWNEDRLALIETKDYLIKKINNLKEDQQELYELKAHRLNVHEICKRFLNKGFDGASDYEIVTVGLVVTLERRFNSSIDDTRRGGQTNYYKIISGSGIEILEQNYLNVVDHITFSENRHNVFSESLEEDLWRTGFFTDNRELFKPLNPYKLEDYSSGVAPPLKRDGGYAIKALTGIVHRNEITSIRLIDQYEQLLKINKELISAIENFILLH